jgi:hypothetical protein
VPVGHAPGDRPGVTPGGCRHGPAVIRWWEELRSPRPGLPLGAELRRPPGDLPEQGRPESPVKDRPPRRRPPTTSGTSEPPPSRTVGVPVVSEGRLGNSPTHFPAAAVNRLPDKGGGHTLGKRRTASRRAPTHVLLDRAAIPKRHRWVSPPRTPRGLAEGGKRAVTPAGVSAAVPVVRFRSDQQLARCNHAEAQCLAHELRIPLRTITLRSMASPSPTCPEARVWSARIKTHEVDGKDRPRRGHGPPRRPGALIDRRERVNLETPRHAAGLGDPLP